MGETWKKVDELAASNLLSGLQEALHPWKQQITLWQADGDDFALVVPLPVVKAAAAQSESLEISQLPGEAPEIVFVSARPSALPELSSELQKEEFSSWLLASADPAPFAGAILPEGLSAQTVDGTILVKTREGTLAFSLSLVSKRQTKASPRFEPVKEPIGESSSNLRQRAEWFKRRSGR